MEPTAILDACVLYPAPLRDFFMHLALLDLFRARWTEEIHTEWIRNVLANRPDLRAEQLMRTKELMNAHAGDSLVIGYESLIENLILPDVNDRHVLAAAIHCKANFIVTFNLKDFPVSVLRSFGITPIHPDEFILSLIEIDAERVFSAAERQRKTLKNPPKSKSEYYETLVGNGLVRTVNKLRQNS